MVSNGRLPACSALCLMDAAAPLPESPRKSSVSTGVCRETSGGDLEMPLSFRRGGGLHRDTLTPCAPISLSRGGGRLKPPRPGGLLVEYLGTRKAKFFLPFVLFCFSGWHCGPNPGPMRVGKHSATAPQPRPASCFYVGHSRDHQQPPGSVDVCSGDMLAWGREGPGRTCARPLCAHGPSDGARAAPKVVFTN